MENTNNNKNRDSVFAKIVLQLYAIESLDEIEIIDTNQLETKIHGGKMLINLIRADDAVEDPLGEIVKIFEVENKKERNKTAKKEALAIITNSNFGEKVKKHILKQLLKYEEEKQRFYKFYIIADTRLFEYDQDTKTIQTSKIKDKEVLNSLTEQLLKTL